MKIRSGVLELFDSKSFLIAGDRPTDITFGDDEGDITLSLKFIDYEDNITPDNQHKFEFELEAKDKALISLINWNNQLGSTTASNLIPSGTLLNRQMYIIFSSKLLAIKPKIREIVFSVYLGDAK